MSEDTIFGKIARGEMDANIVYEDDLCLAFKDLYPAAPMHLLVIPRKPIPRLHDAVEADKALLGHLMLAANKAAHIHLSELKKQPEYQDVSDDFRLVVNNGAGAGQSVFHLHLHVIGGRSLSWPPG